MTTAELAKAIGHSNPKQRIQHHVKIKDENNQLKDEVRTLKEALKKAGVAPGVAGCLSASKENSPHTILRL